MNKINSEVKHMLVSSAIAFNDEKNFHLQFPTSFKKAQK
jgi:hypothetical protein